MEKERFSREKISQEEKVILECYAEKHGFLGTLFRLYKGNYGNLAVAVIMFILKSMPSWVIPLVTACIIDTATSKPDDAVRRLIICGIIILAVMVQNIPTTFLYSMYFSRAQRSVEAGLRGAMIRKLQQLSISFHKDFSSGKIQSKVMRDVESVETFTSQIFSTVITAIVTMTISLVIVINKSIIVFFMFLICVPFTVFLTRLFRRKIQERNHNLRKEIENVSADVLDMEELIPVTRAHSLENYEVNKMVGSITKVASRGYSVDKIHAIFGSSNWFLFTFFQMICLFFTGTLALKGKITIGDVTLYQNYFNTLISQVSSIINLLPIIAKGAESLSSIGEILSSTNIEPNERKQKIKNLDGDFEFKDVNFKYDDDTPVLNGFSLKVEKGETVALVGESGSGKSTVLNLLIGFNQPDSGIFKIDGKDAADIDMRSYRQFLSVVPQNSILFSGTIKGNITYGRKSVTDEMLNYAIKAACLDSVIEKLPNGINTFVGEHGAKLSGGQRQRISIARAIIRNPQVIIFDEATSALDSVTENEIQTAIDNLTRDRTTFIVAHRLSTIMGADVILVMRDGNVVEKGNHEELLAKKGFYFELYNSQFAD